jgi:hypothetical protein
MKFDPDNLLKIGTEVVFIKNVPENDIKAGTIGEVEDNKIFEWTYSIRVGKKIVPVYSSEIDPIETLYIPERLSIL